jgi:hypothetical protein
MLDYGGIKLMNCRKSVCIGIMAVFLLSAAPKVAATNCGSSTITVGSTGNALVWCVTSNITSTNRTWSEFKNGTKISSGTWTPNTPFQTSIDGFAIGDYNITLKAKDQYNSTLTYTTSNTVIVHVIAGAADYTILIVWLIIAAAAIIVICIIIKFPKKHHGKGHKHKK